MKKIVIVTAVSLLSACSSLSQKSLSGTYQGTLPCADCSKIEAKLTLNPDNTYQYNTVYYKKKDRHPFVEKGVYSWDKNKSNVIHLNNSGNLKLLVSDEKVEICDNKGNVANSHINYTLKKVSP